MDESDIVIAEISPPSLGVGRETVYAQYIYKMPIYCLYLEGARVSWMLKGNEYVKTQSYSEVSEVYEHIAEIFEE